MTPHNSAVTSPADVVTAFADNLECYSAGGIGALRNTFSWDHGY